MSISTSGDVLVAEIWHRKFFLTSAFFRGRGAYSASSWSQVGSESCGWGLCVGGEGVVGERWEAGGQSSFGRGESSHLGGGGWRTSLEEDSL